MINHNDLGDNVYLRSKNLLLFIRSGHAAFGGHRPGKIYGTLQCRSGKRMKIQNRVFFADEQEALKAGYRPCAHCLPAKYKEWKSRQPAAQNIYNGNNGNH